ncbi:putative secondary metabolism biosynthetic enzyme [Neofusicoccum ribis]|uniref:Secondary metabolism biosynthetic enzyme n=1 Tax=Neofusicoccum ribis TaxID=45134 RepID=A0ABR3SAI9_9PEZI
MASYLITGSSRGLGLALVNHLVTQSGVGTIFATARSESDALKKAVVDHPDLVKFVELDAADRESVKAAVTKVQDSLGGNGLDFLINNAGIMPFTPDGIENMTDLESTFNTNVTTAHNVTSAFLPLLKKGTEKKIVNISTTLGSIGMAPAFKVFPVYAYKISKAALNMLTVQYAQAVEAEGFTVICVSPGWLQTDLGGANADLPAATGAKAVYDVFSRASVEDTGKFFNIHVPDWEKTEGPNQYDGISPPW